MQIDVLVSDQRSLKVIKAAIEHFHGAQLSHAYASYKYAWKPPTQTQFTDMQWLKAEVIGVCN